MNRALSCLLPVLVLGLSGCASAPTVDAPVSDKVDAAATERAAGTPLAAGNVDRALLAALIFDETNRVRAAAGLPRLRAWERLDAAADTQAAVGAIFRPPSHTNPFALMATPQDRVRLAGIKPERVAENIALLPLPNAPAGVGLRRGEGGSPRFVDALTDEPVAYHTYASLARAVVAAWMGSPGHRAHILDPGLHFLGCSVAEARSMEGVPMVFCVQVFCTPARR